MNTRKTLLAIALAAAASTVSAAIQAEVLAPTSASPAASGTPATATVKVVDQKTSAVRYAYPQPQNEFVGTSAPAISLATKKPGWYAFGHP